MHASRKGRENIRQNIRDGIIQGCIEGDYFTAEDSVSIVLESDCVEFGDHDKQTNRLIQQEDCSVSESTKGDYQEQCMNVFVQEFDILIWIQK